MYMPVTQVCALLQKPEVNNGCLLLSVSPLLFVFLIVCLFEMEVSL